MIIPLLLKATGDPSSKFSIAAVTCLTAVLSSFGPGVVKPSGLYKSIRAMLNSKHPGLRQAGLNLMVECARWGNPNNPNKSDNPNKLDNSMSEMERVDIDIQI